LADAQWVIESYLLFLAALLLVGGFLGDRFGRRRVFALGIALFATASVWCGSSRDVRELIAARAVQGVGAALLTPGSLAIISASFGREQRGRAIGIWSGSTSIVAGLGPLVGGWLIDHGSWRWAFWINVPLALTVLAILFWRVPESRDESAPRGLDWQGALLATAGLGGIVYGLIESENPMPGRLGAVALGVFGLVGFVIVEATSRAPMMPVHLFQSRTFRGANALTLLLYAALSGALFFFPFDLIQVQGYSPTAAGASLLPFILMMFFLSSWSGGLVARFGARPPLILGPLVCALGFGLFAIPDVGGSYFTTFFPAVFTLGLGMAVTVAPLTTAVMGAVEASHAGLASGINNAISRAAGLISVAIFGVLLSYGFDRSLDQRLGALALSPEVLQDLRGQRVKLAAIVVPDALDRLTRAAVKRAVAGSFVAGFRLVMLGAAGLAVASSLTASVLIEPEEATPTAEEG
jgi:EmrB/QacA subfamily drug resistance transporter